METPEKANIIDRAKCTNECDDWLKIYRTTFLPTTYSHSRPPAGKRTQWRCTIVCERTSEHSLPCTANQFWYHRRIWYEWSRRKKANHFFLIQAISFSRCIENWSHVVNQSRRVRIRIQLPRCSGRLIGDEWMSLSVWLRTRPGVSTAQLHINLLLHDSILYNARLLRARSRMDFFLSLRSRSTSAWRPEVYDKFGSTPLNATQRTK